MSIRERDKNALKQQHGEQRSVNPSMERWLADTGPFCATVKPEEKEAKTLGGLQKGTEQDRVDDSKVYAGIGYDSRPPLLRI